MPRSPSNSRPTGEHILAVATDLFFDKSYGGVTVDEIGAAAGLSGPGIYRHFKGKGEILAAVFDRAIDGLLSVVGNESADPLADLEHRIRAHARFVLNHRKLAAIRMREVRSLSAAHRARLRRREATYIRLWIECIERCVPDRDKAEAELAALTALGSLNSLPNWPNTAATQSDIEDAITAFVLRGLGLRSRGRKAARALAI